MKSSPDNPSRPAPAVVFLDGLAAPPPPTPAPQPEAPASQRRPSTFPTGSPMKARQLEAITAQLKRLEPLLDRITTDRQRVAAALRRGQPTDEIPWGALNERRR